MPRNEHDPADIVGPILQYLREHPEAADTAEGIRAWWLQEQGAGRSIGDVRVALEQMVERGLLTRIDRVGMSTVYRGARRREDQSSGT